MCACASEDLETHVNISTVAFGYRSMRVPSVCRRSHRQRLAAGTRSVMFSGDHSMLGLAAHWLPRHVLSCVPRTGQPSARPLFFGLRAQLPLLLYQHDGRCSLFSNERPRSSPLGAGLSAPVCKPLIRVCTDIGVGIRTPVCPAPPKSSHRDGSNVVVIAAYSPRPGQLWPPDTWPAVASPSARTVLEKPVSRPD